MQNLYYDMSTMNWVQTETLKPLFLGKNNHLLSYSGSISQTMLPFPLSRNRHNKVGPLIGILTGDSKKGFVGNTKTMIRLQNELSNQGALCFTFTPSSVKKDFIEGFYYLKSIKKWVKMKCPLPDAVYNRIPYRSSEEEPSYLRTLTFLKDHRIPYFNPGFFSKWEVYQILAKNKRITNHLPHTVLFDSEIDFINMLDNHKVIYAKAIKGHKGKGIWKISAFDSEVFVQSLETEYSFVSIHEALALLKPIFTKEKYLLQEAVIPDTYQGKQYDLRILCHYLQDKHIVSGIGIRLSGDQQITTHIPNGGSIIPLSSVKDRLDLLFLQALIQDIGKQLCRGFNQFIGEFSVDIGKSIDGHYYIYEVNSKPMVFDEPNIRKNGVKNLAKLLISLSSY